MPKESSRIQPQNSFLKPFFLVGWGCVALVAVWQFHVRINEPTASISAGALLLVSLMFSRYVLGLPFTSGPMLYLALLGLFHLGFVVPWALDLYNINRAPWFAPQGLSHALVLVSYSILAYQFGLFAALRGERFSAGLPIERDPIPENSKMFIAGNFTFVCGVIMSVLGLIQLDPTGYYRITYSDTFRLRAESDPRFFGTGMTFAAIGLCMAVAGASRQRTRLILLCAALWALMLFYLGFRGPALIICLIVYAVALKKGMNFPRVFPWLASAFLLVAIPIMGIARDEPLNNRAFDGSINVLDAPAEMGQSIRPLIETEALTGHADYRHGKTYLIALKAVVPNLALHWEAPTPESPEDLPPSQWITAITEPWTYRNYGGIGFSAIAEPYMNFGIAGVVGYFFLLAYALVRLEKIAIHNSYVLASWGLILGPLLWTVRNDFTSFFRPAVWGLLCLGIVRMSSKSFGLVSRVWKQRNARTSVREVNLDAWEP